MSTNALDRLEFDARTAKRAQWEAFEFAVPAPGLVNITNGSYAADEQPDHTYTVKVEDGVPVTCSWPSDEYNDGACKHRVSVAMREPVVDAARDDLETSPVRVDGGRIVDAGDDGAEVVDADAPATWKGPFTEYDKYGQPTGARYVRCSECGVEVLEGDTEHATHGAGCDGVAE
jgi:nitrite reductase/ring-hydroxylating ferredoxin subunit